MPVAAPAAVAPVEVAPFRPFSAHVVRTERLTPGMTRVTFGGDDLAGFVNGGRDQRIKLLFPSEGQTEPILPDQDANGGWYRAWQRMPAAWRPVMRTYTVRAQRVEQGEVDVDLALHAGATAGPASRGARAARPGDRVGIFGPAVPDAGGVEFQLPADAGWVLLAGDETALPAIGAILESLPSGFPAEVFLRAADPADRQDLRTAAAARFHWLHGDTLLSRAVAAASADFRSEAPYVWLAGEAAQVRAIRRHLVNQRAFSRESVTFMGYWRQGRSEDA
ncbi:siderophore-interacting protein [Streptacidiphilus sp. N1-3]|uniref:Siderophore-interacting protein n=1 Tax=Streptacidiphilus alkalitolerans TaxID=3342712 RepID=A0ABV6X4Q1_9ACTN